MRLVVLSKALAAKGVAPGQPSMFGGPKATVKAHTRRTKGGKVAMVVQHQRAKKPAKPKPEASKDPTIEELLKEARANNAAWFQGRVDKLANALIANDNTLIDWKAPVYNETLRTMALFFRAPDPELEDDRKTEKLNVVWGERVIQLLREGAKLDVARHSNRMEQRALTEVLDMDRADGVFADELYKGLFKAEYGKPPNGVWGTARTMPAFQDAHKKVMAQLRGFSTAGEALEHYDKAKVWETNDAVAQNTYRVQQLAKHNPTEGTWRWQKAMDYQESVNDFVLIDAALDRTIGHLLQSQIQIERQDVSPREKAGLPRLAWTMRKEFMTLMSDDEWKRREVEERQLSELHHQFQHHGARGRHWGAASPQNATARAVVAGAGRNYIRMPPPMGEVAFEPSAIDLAQGAMLRTYAQRRLAEHSREKWPTLYRGMQVPTELLEQLKGGDALALTGCTAFSFYKDVASRYMDSFWTKDQQTANRVTPVLIKLTRTAASDRTIAMWHESYGKDDDKGAAFEVLSSSEGLRVKSVTRNGRSGHYLIEAEIAS